MNDYGPDWLRSHGKTLSADGERCARFVDWLFAGIYHEDRAVLAARWDTFYVKLNLDGSRLATWDFNELTRLVVGAHAFAIRAELAPASPQRLRLLLHPRERTGSTMRRHPGIAEAVRDANRSLTIHGGAREIGA